MKRTLTALLFFFPFSSTTLAATFNPVDEVALQANLVTAQANGESDIINLPAGTFYTSNNAGNAFAYNSAENYSLTINGAGIDATVLKGGTNNRALRIVSSGNAAADILISNLTLQDAYGSPSSTLGGCAYFNSGAGDVTIDSVSVTNCIALDGGGIYAITNAGNLTLTNSTVASSFASSDGGGVYLHSYGGNVEISASVISNNQSVSTYAGGCMVCYANCSVIDSVFEYNTNALGGGGSVGGLSMSGSNGTYLVSGSSFNDNEADTQFGGLVINDTATAQVTVQNSFFTHNVASQIGGGLYVQITAGTVEVSDSDISYNQSGGFGGVTLLADIATIDFIGNTISENDATATSGAGVVVAASDVIKIINNVVYSNTAIENGAGLYLVGSANNLAVINNTVSQNSAGSKGGGIYFHTLDAGTIYQIYNNAFYANVVSAGSGEDVYVESNGMSPSVEVFYNNLSQFCRDADCDIAYLGASQGNNFSVDPLFFNAADGDFTLSENSPLLNVGTVEAPYFPLTDFDGFARVQGDGVDLGAYERTVTTGAVSDEEENQNADAITEVSDETAPNADSESPGAAEESSEDGAAVDSTNSSDAEVSGSVKANTGNGGCSLSLARHADQDLPMPVMLGGALVGLLLLKIKEQKVSFPPRPKV